MYAIVRLETFIVRLTEVLNETCSDYWPGIVSSIGNNQQEVTASLREGRSGITFSEEFKDSGMRSHVWGNVKLDTTGLIDRKVVRFMNDASIYAYLSMQEAIGRFWSERRRLPEQPTRGPDCRLRRFL